MKYCRIRFERCTVARAKKRSMFRCTLVEEYTTTTQYITRIPHNNMWLYELTPEKDKAWIFKDEEYMIPVTAIQATFAGDCQFFKEEVVVDEALLYRGKSE